MAIEHVIVCAVDCSMINLVQQCNMGKCTNTLGGLIFL